jgi:cysteinyl-tRNA synthetase
LQLFNSYTNKYEEVVPNALSNIRIYLCGVTVYDNSHIGHARTIVVFDILRRYLRYLGLSVIFVQNFTDIDDKIINRSKLEGLSPEELSKKYIKSYYSDFATLNVLNADLYPKATDHINEILAVITGLVNKQIAYVTTNGIYFRVKRFESYGRLSKKTLEQLESGSRIEIDPKKEDPLDFALWKFSSETPSWSSPWGNGRPGWHIECSAMALKYLGSEIEIHGGGQDLIFPHHENEIAQSESYSGTIFAKIWMHVGMVTFNDEKMSKSLGNVVSLKEVLSRCGPNALRLYLLSVHYAKPLDYNNENLSEAILKWRQIEHSIFELQEIKRRGQEPIEAIASIKQIFVDFQQALNEDLNTSLAISYVLKIANLVNKLSSLDTLTNDASMIILPILKTMLDILGLKVLEVSKNEKLQIEKLIEERNALRRAGLYLDSDAIRKKLYHSYNVELTDHKDYTSWKKVESPLHSYENRMSDNNRI